LEEFMKAINDLDRGQGRRGNSLFLEKLVLGFLRVMLGRDASTGDKVEIKAEDKAASVSGNGAQGQTSNTGVASGAGVAAHHPIPPQLILNQLWGDIMNPITFPEVLRRHLSLHLESRAAELFELASLKGDNPGLPPGGLFVGPQDEEEDEFITAVRAMKVSCFRELSRGQVLALLRTLCDCLLESTDVQAAMFKRMDVRQPSKVV